MNHNPSKGLIHTVVRTQDWSEQVSHWRAKLHLIRVAWADTFWTGCVWWDKFKTADKNGLSATIRLPQQTSSKAAWAISKSVIIIFFQSVIYWSRGCWVYQTCSTAHADMSVYITCSLICCTHISVYSGGSRGGFHGFHGTPLSQESTADYVASYWAIIAYFLGFVRNCCGFCD